MAGRTKKQLEDEVERLDVEIARLNTTVSNLQDLLKQAAHDTEPWQQIKRFFGMTDRAS